VIVHIDTSALIDALTGPRRALPRLTAFVHEGHRIAMSVLVYYEWRRGPRTRAELAAQESVLPLEGVVPFDAGAAALAAGLYAKVTKPRGREIDLAIAACALSQGAGLWTLNPADFRDIPNLTVF
jgi:predicted nucleic acid-binding protein